MRPIVSLSSLVRIATLCSALGVGALITLTPGIARADDDGAQATTGEPGDPMASGPKSGALTFDLRPVAVGAIKTPSSVDIELTGLQIGVGKRLSSSWYLGGSGEAGLVMNLGGDAAASTSLMYRVGPEARYVFGQATAQMSTNGDAGPWTPVPFVHWVGLRAGAQTLDSGAHYGAFTELEYGGDAWTGKTFQFGFGVAAGAYSMPSAPQPEPYATATFRLGFDFAG